MSALIAFGLCLVLTPLLARGARRIGLVDRPTDDGLKIHAEPKPLSGGVGVIGAALVALAVTGDGLDPWGLAAILILLGVGVLDDAVSLPRPLRVGVELIAGIVLAIGGVTFESMGMLGPTAVVIAVVAVANAVNVVDGQDGLAGGLAAVAAIGMTLVSATTGSAGPLGPTLAASLLAFLLWNRPPARIFLGDGGAYAVGGLLVLLAATSSGSWAGLLGSATCLAVFGVEIGSTFLRRAFARASIGGGDRTHAYDLLAERLHGRERATGAMLAAGTTAAGLGWLASVLPLPGSIAVAAAAVVAGAAGIWSLWRRYGVRLRGRGSGTVAMDPPR